MHEILGGLRQIPLQVGTVPRVIVQEPQRPLPAETAESTERVVTAKHPNHVWHIDLTTVPTGAGFWAPWVPFALPQR